MTPLILLSKSFFLITLRTRTLSCIYYIEFLLLQCKCLLVCLYWILFSVSEGDIWLHVWGTSDSSWINNWCRQRDKGTILQEFQCSHQCFVWQQTWVRRCFWMCVIVSPTTKETEFSGGREHRAPVTPALGRVRDAPYFQVGNFRLHLSLDYFDLNAS